MHRSAERLALIKTSCTPSVSLFSLNYELFASPCQRTALSEHAVSAVNLTVKTKPNRRLALRLSFTVSSPPHLAYITSQSTPSESKLFRATVYAINPGNRLLTVMSFYLLPSRGVLESSSFCLTGCSSSRKSKKGFVILPKRWQPALQFCRE